MSTALHTGREFKCTRYSLFRMAELYKTWIMTPPGISLLLYQQRHNQDNAFAGLSNLS